MTLGLRELAYFEVSCRAEGAQRVRPLPAGLPAPGRDSQSRAAPGRTSADRDPRSLEVRGESVTASPRAARSVRLLASGGPGASCRNAIVEPTASRNSAHTEVRRHQASIVDDQLLAEPRLGRRTVLTFPLLPPPQKN